MRKFVGGIAAAIVWLLATGLFSLIDNLFHISASHSLYAVFAIGVPIVLAWFSFHLAPDVLLVLLGMLLELFGNLIDKISTRKSDCNEIEPIASEPKKMEAAPEKVSAPVSHSTETENVTVNKKSRNKSYYAYFPAVLDGMPLVYHYQRIKIDELDYDLLDSMIENDDYSIEVFPNQTGGAVIQKGEKQLGTIDKYGDMISDWQRRGEPMVCKITHLEEGRESIGFGFYRDIEAKLENCNHAVVRLTKNRSEDMQIEVSCLSDGEMLDIFPEYTYEEDAIPVQRKSGGEVGFLPKKFNKINEENGIRGVFVDHVEESVNDNLDYKYIAYVRVYWD